VEFIEETKNNIKREGYFILYIYIYIYETWCENMRVCSVCCFKIRNNKKNSEESYKNCTKN